MVIKGFEDSSNKVAISKFIEAISFLQIMDDECVIDPNAKSILDALCSVMSKKMMI